MKEILNRAYQIVEKEGMTEGVFLIWLICVLSTHSVMLEVKIAGFLLAFGGLLAQTLQKSAL